MELRRLAQGHDESVQRGDDACVCHNMTDPKRKEKSFKKMLHMPQHRRRFDSVICSLSPPTFTRCRTTSRMRVLQIVHSVPKFDSKHFERVNIFFSPFHTTLALYTLSFHIFFQRCFLPVRRRASCNMSG